MTVRKKIPDYVGDDYRFDSSAEYYLYRPDYPEDFYQELRARLGDLKNARVVDLGCGDGRVALRLAAFGAQVLAIDISESMVRTVGRKLRRRKGLNVHPIRGEATQLPFPPGTIDYVLLGQAFHWMRRDLVTGEVSRVLRASGQWVVFWIQPVTPLPLSMRISDTLISEYVPHYHPDSAHDLTSKSKIPRGSGFRVQTWCTEFTCTYRPEDYVNAVLSKSYVATSLNHDSMVEFRSRLLDMLERNGLSPIEERYLLTAFFVQSTTQ